MKKFKKLVFLACFVMLVALMAIAVSAYDTKREADVDLSKTGASSVASLDGETFVPNEGTTVYSLPIYNNAKEALTWYVDGTELKSIPTYKVIYVNKNGWLRFKQSTDTGTGVADTVIDPKAIIVLNLQDSTIDALNGGKNSLHNDHLRLGGAGSGSGAAIQCVYISNSTVSSDINIFRGCTKLHTVNFDEGTKLTTLGKFMFAYCTSLKEIHLPSNITSLPAGDSDHGVFSHSGLEKVVMDWNITSIPYGTFSNCTSLKEIIFPDNCKITEIGDTAFKNCTSLEKITLPNTVTKIASRAFWNCANLKYVNLGASFTTFSNTVAPSGNSTFHMCNALETVVIPASLELSGAESYTFSSGSSNIKFFFTGTKEQVATLKEKFLAAGNNTKFTSIADSNIVDYNSDDYKNIDAAKSYIIFNYNKCEAFYSGVHTLSENPVIAYKDGFDKEGTSANVCTRECGYCKNEILAPIFAASGYSTSKTADAIYAGFTVDPTALAKYNSLVGEGKELKYGIVIVNMGAETLASDASLAFNASGVVNSETAIQVEIKDTSFTRFGFTLTGFTTDELKALNLVMSAYVIDGNGNMSYVQNGTATDTSYYVTSVDAIVGTETKGKLGVMTFNKLSSVVTA